MKIINILFAIITFIVWGYSLYDNWGIAINIMLGIMGLIFLFLDDLLYKPINLIGWTIKKQSSGETK